MSSALARRAELLDVTVEGFGVLRVQLADDGIGVAGELASRGIYDRGHVY